MEEKSRVQREREAAAEAKIAAQKAGGFGAVRPSAREQPAESVSAAPPRIALPAGKLTWREREAMKAAGQTPPASAPAASPAPAAPAPASSESEGPKRFVPPAMRQGGAPGGGWREREAAERGPVRTESPATGGRTESPATGGRWEPPSARGGRSFGGDRKDSPASGGAWVPPARRGQQDGAPAREGERERERESAPPPASGPSDGKYRPGAFKRS
jgi:translation initiation factor 3 subunit A